MLCYPPSIGGQVLGQFFRSENWMPPKECIMFHAWHGGILLSISASRYLTLLMITHKGFMGYSI